MKLKLSVITLLATVLSVSTAAADQLADIKSRGTLTCGTLGTAEPFSFADPATREIAGYDIDLCKGIADDMGVELQMKPMSVEARIPELVQGRVDVLAGNLGYTPERAEQIDYTTAYFVSLQKLLVKADSDFAALDDLGESRISAPKGSSSERYVREALPQATLLTFQDPPSAFLALAQSKVDSMILSEINAEKFVAQTGEKFKFIDQAVAEEFWGLGIRKNEPALLEQVNATLKRLEESGEGQKIFDKWLGEATAYKLKKPFKFDEPVSDPVLRPAR
ncbi:cysteine ABC transporter substrate-binding protein [Phyllobacterium phragmitis]|uniref:Cysteine ABC transporter substrate-binding protein n=1 Tax=Phyllobacterium phragmitis TaxID=2670329 RepID=A0A2S9ISQ1_9HYPH|nr:ABC transporter substrate-binding protein [Phyllobacterium phragmitis]PRD43563.1 cysteine ABC transporter substrate-binding protein [Phyllobacterium phragmitis]